MTDVHTRLQILDTCLVALVARLVQSAQCGQLLLVYPAGFDCLKALGRIAAQPWAKEQILPGISRLGKTEKRLLGSIKGIMESWWQAVDQKVSQSIPRPQRLAQMVDSLTIMAFRLPLAQWSSTPSLSWWKVSCRKATPRPLS
jgi:hypothetical protein